jgi:hypothetical protein
MEKKNHKENINFFFVFLGEHARISIEIVVVG